MTQSLGQTPEQPYQAIVVGGGFGGIGMAIELKRRNFKHFVVLEKGHDVGGVWRDNTYPGAACDVPSHLYSFSFEPKPDWSHTFSRQPEILDYLRQCADKYAVRSHFQFNTEVAGARFYDDSNLWSVELLDGSTLWARTLITAMGQLSRPIMPKLAGMDTFLGQCFHSARWDHSQDLLGKRVAVVGTGASAIQFVPAIADRVASMKVFQRSPSHIIPRRDRQYSDTEKNRNSRYPWLMKLKRLAIYLEYESRALAFTRFKGLLEHGVGKPFRAMLKRQVKDPALREALTPSYTIGCKRILLSDDYYKAITKPTVNLITEPIKRVYEYGIETADGRRHEADVIIYGTGFAATEFLSPLKIVGSQGQDLNTAWQQGAKAHLGMTVPGFPNFFMLYGPNTNLGHNSIVYMLESQIRYISRALRRQRNQHAQRVEVNSTVYSRFNQSIQSALARTVWNGCDSWYVDDNGHNSTGWPGFTLTYRWLTSTSRLNELNMTGRHHPDVAKDLRATVIKSSDTLDNLIAAGLRTFLRVAFKPFVGKPFPVWFQRGLAQVLALTMLGRLGTFSYQANLGGIRARVTAPRNGENGGALLFLHGGAYCLGSPWTHRAMTTRLAHEAQMPVYALDYRLAPEHPYPACIDDAVRGYQALLQMGHAPDKIVVAGDSAGGGLSLALALRLRELNLPLPSGLILVSPIVDSSMQGVTFKTKAQEDPMLRQGWTEQSTEWLQVPAGTACFTPLNQDLQGLPPILIQVGDEEILLDDSLRLARRLQSSGQACDLEIYESRWHVFHLQAAFLKSAEKALKRMAAFAQARAQGAQTQPLAPVEEQTADSRQVA